MSDESTATPVAEAPETNTETATKVDNDSAKVDKPKLGDGVAAAVKKLFKVKIDNTESEVDEEELIRGYQLRKASDARFQTAAEKEAQIEKLIEMAKKDPRVLLSHPSIGVDVRKFAEEVLARELEEDMLDPREKEIRKLKAERDERDEKLKAIEEKDRKAKEEIQINELRDAYAKDIETTVRGSGLPYNAGIVNRVRDYLLAGLQSGQDLAAKDVIHLVKKDFETDIRSLFETSPAEIVAELLGEGNLKKVREWDMARLKNPKGKTPEAQGKPSTVRKEEKRNKSKTTDQYFKELQKKFGDSRD